MSVRRVERRGGALARRLWRWSPGFAPILATSILSLLPAGRALAGEADVLAVKIRPDEGGTWRFDVTVHHADEGWEHYADGWEVVGPDGTVLGKRKLHHPHVEENTFTRWQPRIAIPAGVTEVTVRAHDSVHGYGGKEVVVPIPAPGGAAAPSPARKAAAPPGTADDADAAPSAAGKAPTSVAPRATPRRAPPRSSRRRPPPSRSA